MALRRARGSRALGVPGSGRLSADRLRTEWLFVYGTLRAGRAPRTLAWAEALPREPARAPGRLLDLGPYPGAVADDDGGARIVGELVCVPVERLAALDRYEGFDPAHPEASLFVRERCFAEDAEGRVRPCWIYRYAGNPASHAAPEGGDGSPPSAGP